MKKIFRAIFIFFLGISLVISVSPTAQGMTQKGGSNKPSTQVEYEAKKVRKPPYSITVNNGEIKEDFSQAGLKAEGAAKLNLIGISEGSTIDSRWTIRFSFDYSFKAETETIPGMNGKINFGIGAVMQTSGDCYLDNKLPPPTGKKKKSNWTIDPILQKWVTKKPEVKLAYEGELEVESEVRAYNVDGKNSFSGKLSSEDMAQWAIAEGSLIGSGNTGEKKIKLKISIYSNDKVEVFVYTGNREYGPYEGILASDWDIEAKRKEKAKWPIWGIWTNESPYEPMPNIEKDLKEIEKDSSKKINYKNGSWVMLKEGKKEEASQYKLAVITDEDITIESGEIWAYPGSALFVPKEKKIYSTDLRELKSSFIPDRYPQLIEYNSISDTIDYFTIGSMVRVRSINLTGVWSMNQNQIFPDIKKPEVISGGIWYKFTRDLETDEKNKSSSGANYTFVRVTSIPNKEVRIDKGKARLYPLQGDEFMSLYEIESEITSKDGSKKQNKTELEYVAVSGYDKTKGEITLGETKLYLIVPPALRGRWATLNPATEPPDVVNGAFRVKDVSGNAFDPPKGSQWIVFDADKRQFTWTENLKEPQGVLVRKGSYKLVEGVSDKDTILEFSDITASYYPVPGDKAAEAFKDREYMYGQMYFSISFNDKELRMDNTTFIPIPKDDK